MKAFLAKLKDVKTPFDSVLAKFLDVSFKDHPDLALPSRFDFSKDPTKLVMVWNSSDGTKSLHVEINDDFMSYLFTDSPSKTTVSCSVNTQEMPRDLCKFMKHFRKPN